MLTDENLNHHTFILCSIIYLPFLVMLAIGLGGGIEFNRSTDMLLFHSNEADMQ